MNVHISKSFEMVTPRPARYSLGISVLAICSLSLAGWFAIGIAINLFF
jgi:hypothetical protein